LRNPYTSGLKITTKLASRRSGGCVISPQAGMKEARNPQIFKGNGSMAVMMVNIIVLLVLKEVDFRPSSEYNLWMSKVCPFQRELKLTSDLIDADRDGADDPYGIHYEISCV
jgi:hypothetical protein